MPVSPARNLCVCQLAGIIHLLMHMLMKNKDWNGVFGPSQKLWCFFFRGECFFLGGEPLKVLKWNGLSHQGSSNYLVSGNQTIQ